MALFKHLSFLSLLFCIVQCRVPLNQNLNDALPLRNLDPRLLSNLAWNNSDFQEKWISKLTIPSYLQPLFNQLQSELEQNQNLDWLFVGVESEDCKGHVLEWLMRFGPGNDTWLGEKSKWAAHFIDSWGKIPEGILQGHVNSYGDFDECVNAAATDIELLTKRDISKDFDGLYCNTYLLSYDLAMGAAQRKDPAGEAAVSSDAFKAIEEEPIGIRTEALSVEGFLAEMNKPGIVPMFPSVGTCMPNTCSQLELQNIFVNAFDRLYERLRNISEAAEIPFPDNEDLIWPVALTCLDRHKPKPDAPTIIVLIILATLLVLCVGTGVVDYFLNHGIKHDKPPQRSALYKYLMAFSIYTNTKKWLSTRKSADDLGCLHGIRFLSTCWVVFGHTYVIFMNGPQWNTVHLRKIYEYWTALFVINGTYSVDTFFVMSGMLATYNILKMLDKTKGKLNILMLYVHRIIRITPTYAILVGIASTLTIYMGSGPMWPAVNALEENCRKHWWVNLIYINNIYKTDQACNSEAWYLANDMQFYILSPFIIYPLWKFKMIGVALLGVYTIMSLIGPALIVHFYDTPPTFLITGNVDATHIGQIYIRPWSRIQTFFVGVWLGWIFFETRNKKFKLPKWAVALGWLCSTILVLTVMFAIFPWFNPANTIPKAGSMFYAAFNRFTYAVAIAWIIFACVKGYGGIINSFLSWKPFMPLGRLTFCIYLISVHLQVTFHAGLKVPIQFNAYTQLNLFFAHMVISVLAGFVATMLFESPFMILQKLALG